MQTSWKPRHFSRSVVRRLVNWNVRHTHTHTYTDTHRVTQTHTRFTYQWTNRDGDSQMDRTINIGNIPSVGYNFRLDAHIMIRASSTFDVDHIPTCTCTICCQHFEGINVVWSMSVDAISVLRRLWYDQTIDWCDWLDCFLPYFVAFSKTQWLIYNVVCRNGLCIFPFSWVLSLHRSSKSDMHACGGKG